MQTSKTDILITVHGIRTFGQWQDRLKNLVRVENPDIIVETYGYGYFNALAFFIPFFRWLAVRAFQRRLRDLLKQQADAQVSIVAHSFGTHIVAWGLRGLRADEMPHVRTLILSGSVLKSNFNWSSLFQTDRVQRVVNDCGLNDGILLLSQLFVPFNGMAGRFGFYGFTDDRLLNRYFRGGHSHYFQPTGPDPDAFMRRWWLPLLAHDEPVEHYDDRESPGPLQGLKYALMGVADPLKLAVYGGVISAAIYWGVVLPEQSLRLEQARAIARDASKLLASGNVQDASRKALDVLERPGPLIPESYDVLYNALFNSSVRAKQIDVGNYDIDALVKPGREGEIVVLTDRGNLSIWSSEGVNKFRLDDLDFKSSPTFAPDGSALFYNNSLHDVERFDLVTKSKTKLSHFMLNPELTPSNKLLALDGAKLLSCRDKKLIEYSAASGDGEGNELAVAWQHTLNITGNCDVIYRPDRSRVLVGTSEAEIVVFDMERKETLKTLSGRAAGLLKFGIDRLIGSDTRVVARGFPVTYVLLGDPPGQPYRFDSYNFAPQFSKDGRFLIHGWNGKLDSKEWLVILDLSRPDVPKGLGCRCHLVGFVGTSQFVTLDDSRAMNLRNLPDGEIASQLFVFEADVDKLVFLEDRNLAVGLRKRGIASFARLGHKDNSLLYGGLDGQEALSDAMWLEDDVVLVKVSNFNKNNWMKTDAVTYKLVRFAQTGSEVFWSRRSDELPRASDQWSAAVSRALVRDDRIPTLYDELKTAETVEAADKLLEAAEAADKSLPGDRVDLEVAGDDRVVARQVPAGISLYDKGHGSLVFKVPQTASQISSIWISRDRRLVAVGSQDGVLRFWNLQIGDIPIATVNAHGAEIERLSANGSQSFLLSADREGRIRVWPLLTREQLIAAANLH
jgi:WD40 repeat protein